MRLIKPLSLIIFSMILLIPRFSPAAEHERESCQVCGMYIDAHQNTAGRLQYKDGRTVETCGVACMLRLVNDEGGPNAFSAITVHGWTHNKEIAAQEAAYVIGSTIIPDMLPNLIAFATPKQAAEFRKEYGGEQLTFTQALLSISPMGMTMPAKIKSAVVPAQGATGSGLGYMYMKMDAVMTGSDNIDPEEFIQRPGQMMSPKEMRTSGEMAMFSYGLTDDLALGLKISDLHKTMQMYTMGGKKITTTNNDGLSDLDVNLRYGLWKNTYYSKFFSLLFEATLPTGDFDLEYKASPGLQLGTGDFTGTAGLLYSQRIREFWFHTMLSYTHKLENSDNYKFGDTTAFGAALHYTPNYDFMMGLELSAADTAKNEDNGVDIDNTGGFRSYITGVCNWKFLTALGGNFNLRLTAGLPLYEDMNHFTFMGAEKVQLGGGYFYTAMLSFKRRFSL